MNRRFVAKQAVVINAPSRKVWDALVNPEIARQYMFGTNAIADWKKSSPIAVKEEVKGKTYSDKGALLEVEPERLIKYSFYSPLSGLPDAPEITKPLLLNCRTQKHVQFFYYRKIIIQPNKHANIPSKTGE